MKITKIQVVRMRNCCTIVLPAGESVETKAKAQDHNLTGLVVDQGREEAAGLVGVKGVKVAEVV